MLHYWLTMHRSSTSVLSSGHFSLDDYDTAWSIVFPDRVGRSDAGSLGNSTIIGPSSSSVVTPSGLSMTSCSLAADANITRTVIHTMMVSYHHSHHHHDPHSCLCSSASVASQISLDANLTPTYALGHCRRPSIADSQSIVSLVLTFAVGHLDLSIYSLSRRRCESKSHEAGVGDRHDRMKHGQFVALMRNFLLLEHGQSELTTDGNRARGYIGTISVI